MLLLLLNLIFAAAVSSEPAPQSGQVSGQVVEEGSGAPLSGASVTVYTLENGAFPAFPPGASSQSVTDQGGHYLIDGLAPGRYRINVQKAGYASSLPPDPFRTFDIAAGQTLGGVNISLPKGAVITGQILDPSSEEPVIGAMVTAMRRPGVAPGVVAPGTPSLIPAGPSVQTNDLGEFRLFGLAAGDYIVAANAPPNFRFAVSSQGAIATPAAAPANAFVTTFFPGTVDSSTAQAVTVAAGQVATGIVIRLLTAQTHQVSGTVIDESGTPVAGVMVMLRGNPRTAALGAVPVGGGTSDASGKFVIRGVAPGSYVVTVSVAVTFSGQKSGIGARTSFVTTLNPLTRSRELDVTVADTDVEGVRIVVQRPQ